MKKFLIFCVLLVVGISYVHTHYTVQHVLDYAAKKNDPKLTPKVTYYAGWYLVMKDRYDEAIVVLEGLNENWPDSEYKGEAWYHLGEAYESIRKKDKAKELYEKYLEEYPKGPNADLAKRKLELFKAQ